MGVSMIEIGALVKWRDGDDLGLVVDYHQTDGCSNIAYKIKWFEGGMGVLSAWQFEVIA